MDNGAASYLRFLSGDKNGFTEIVGEYKSGLMLFINSFISDIHISEEAADEVFLKLYVKKPKYKSEYSFKTWLYAIGKNTALNYLKSLKRKRYAPVEDYFYVADETDIEAEVIGFGIWHGQAVKDAYERDKLSGNDKMIVSESDNSIGECFTTTTTTASEHSSVITTETESRIMIGVKYVGQDDIILYRNVSYRPDLLEDMVEDLGLKRYLTFISTDWYDLKYTKMMNCNFTEEDIWENLFDDVYAERVNSSLAAETESTQMLSITCQASDIMPFDAKIEIRDNGYLLIKLMGCETAFYVGEEAALKFIVCIKYNFFSWL